MEKKTIFFHAGRGFFRFSRLGKIYVIGRRTCTDTDTDRARHVRAFDSIFTTTMRVFRNVLERFRILNGIFSHLHRFRGLRAARHKREIYSFLFAQKRFYFFLQKHLSNHKRFSTIAQRRQIHDNCI